MSLRRETRGLINLDTRVVEGEIPVLAHHTLPLRDDWMFDHKKGDLRLAEADLTGIDYKVYFICKSLLNFKNDVQVNQTDIANHLKVPRQNINRSIKKLIDLKILVEGKKVGKLRTYKLNTFFGWKGHINEEYYKMYDQHSRLLDDGAS